MAFDSSGNLYVANNQGNTIEKFSQSGADLGVFASHGLNYPTGLAFWGDTLYVANDGNNSIESFDSNGNDLGPYELGLNSPQGLVFDGSGNLFVANTGGGTPGNGTIEEFDREGYDLGVFAAGLNDPEGLAFDSFGNLYVADHGDNSVERFAPDGNDGGTLSSAGFNAPWGLAFDARGNLYVSNEGNGIIEEFSSTGADLGEFAYDGGGATFMAFAYAVPAPDVLSIQRFGTNAVLVWTNTLFSLQAAPAVTGAYTNVPNAFSPYAISIGGARTFFRLISN